MYLFPAADVTNHHKCSSLQLPKFIILWFWRSEVGKESEGETPDAGRAAFLPEAPKENVF